MGVFSQILQTLVEDTNVVSTNPNACPFWDVTYPLPHARTYGPCPFVLHQRTMAPIADVGTAVAPYQNFRHAC